MDHLETPSAVQDAQGRPALARLNQLVAHIPSVADPAPSGAQAARFRAETTREIFAMARYLLANGKQVGPSVASLLQQLESGVAPPLPELTAAHFDLARHALPARPIGIAALGSTSDQSTLQSILGPTVGVRRLTVASLCFGFVFFAVSLSESINATNMEKSFLDLSGMDLVFKHVILLASAGLGATFGVLFSVWHDLARRHFDPLSESAHWMRIGLGLVAGIVLSEIVMAQPGLEMPFSGVVLALIGGFSAAFLHRAITRSLLKRAGASLPFTVTSGKSHATSRPPAAG